MSSQPVGPSYYADFQGLEGLKSHVKTDDSHAIRAAAQQFESLFTDMMLKAMREAKLAQGLGDSQESDFYQDMYDQQLSLKMAQGKGLGLADLLVQQLTRNKAAAAASSATGTSTATSLGNATSTGGAASTGGATATSTATPADRISFIRRVEPYAQAAAERLGVSSDTLIAHAALESGWGQHVPALAGGASSFNLFGIKAGTDWEGAAVDARTTEYQSGAAGRVTQTFRAYGSLQQGVNDYVALLQHSRYQSTLGTGTDVGAFAAALTRGGYATDPVYVQKLEATAASVKALRAANGEPLKILAGVPTNVAGESA